jgi:hypothetical protein
LVRLAETSRLDLATAAETALAVQDKQRLRDIAGLLKDTDGAERAFTEEISAELVADAAVIAGRHGRLECEFSRTTSRECVDDMPASFRPRRLPIYSER